MNLQTDYLGLQLRSPLMASALLKNGIEHLSVVENDLREWMETHEYESVVQMRGSLSQLHSPSPATFERAQYIKALTHYPLEPPS